jgi:hypothetical protein
MQLLILQDPCQLFTELTTQIQILPFFILPLSLTTVVEFVSREYRSLGAL